MLSASRPPRDERSWHVSTEHRELRLQTTSSTVPSSTNKTAPSPLPSHSATLENNPPAHQARRHASQGTRRPGSSRDHSATRGGYYVSRRLPCQGEGDIPVFAVTRALMVVRAGFTCSCSWQLSQAPLAAAGNGRGMREIFERACRELVSRTCHERYTLYTLYKGRSTPEQRSRCVKITLTPCLCYVRGNTRYVRC